MSSTNNLPNTTPEIHCWSLLIQLNKELIFLPKYNSKRPKSIANHRIPLPSRELTYPTLGKGQTWFLMGYVSSLEGIFRLQSFENTATTPSVFAPQPSKDWILVTEWGGKNHHGPEGYPYRNPFLFRLLTWKGEQIQKSYGSRIPF